LRIADNQYLNNNMSDSETYTSYYSETEDSNDSYSEMDESIYDYNTIYYEPEEISKTKYNIVICLLSFSNFIVFQRFKNFNMNEIEILTSLMNIESITYTVDIAECLYLDSGECIAIKKTMWFRIIQRVWKKIMATRKDVIKKRTLLSSLIYRTIHGKWPKSCCYLPNIKGMLINLKNK